MTRRPGRGRWHRLRSPPGYRTGAPHEPVWKLVTNDKKGGSVMHAAAGCLHSEVATNWQAGRWQIVGKLQDHHPTIVSSPQNKGLLRSAPAGNQCHAPAATVMVPLGIEQEIQPWLNSKPCSTRETPKPTSAVSTSSPARVLILRPTRWWCTAPVASRDRNPDTQTFPSPWKLDTNP